MNPATSPATALASGDPQSSDPGGTSAVAATAVGITTAAVVLGILRKPLWVGLVLGSAGALLTKVLIDKAAETA